MRDVCVYARVQIPLTRMSAEVAGEGVSPTTGITAEGAFKGLLSRVQLNVSEEVSLLSERRAALITLEGSLTFE